jgi:O-succinylbenzoic acid--CoA ligase
MSVQSPLGCQFTGTVDDNRSVRRLVPLDATPGWGFVAALRRAWDDGDAVLPVDPRLPAPARRALLEALEPDRPVDDGDALVVATSGTSGAPKGVVLTHRAVAASAGATSARLAVDPAADRWLACLPLAHVGGLSVVLRALHTGTGLTFDPDDRAATLVSLVPTQLRRVDPGRFRTIVLGGTAPPGDRPAHCVVTYGLTETGSGVVYDGHPLDGVEARAVGGEVQLRGPMLLRAYRDGTSPLDADGWLATGDAGSVAPDGTVSVLGRMGDVVVSGGEKVWPEAVEPVLAAVEGVAEVGVAGRPDPEWGQRVVAWVVPADPARPPALDALRDAVKAVLPAYAAPREVVLVDALPRTALGKLRRSLLR